jgi:hypothetical protein
MHQLRRVRQEKDIALQTSNFEAGGDRPVDLWVSQGALAMHEGSVAQATPSSPPGREKACADEERRFYDWSACRVLVDRGTPLDDSQRALLTALYSEVCNSFRMLTDVRFKLLAIVPVVSVFALAALLTASTNQTILSSRPELVLALGAFGALATVGLWIYDARNSDLYDDLVSRGRRIEIELGFEHGQFLGRLKPPHWLIKHGNATLIIYLGSTVAWLATAIAGMSYLMSPTTR